MRLQKWLYRGGRPNRLARLLDRVTAAIYARGVRPDYLGTLEVSGRRSGRTIRFPLVMVVIEGERYLVSMLGRNVNWVRNVRAAGGDATLHHGRREEVRLEETAIDRRAHVLEIYLTRAPNARAHLPVAEDAPREELERVAHQVPVFRVVPRSATPTPSTGDRAPLPSPRSPERTTRSPARTA